MTRSSDRVRSMREDLDHMRSTLAAIERLIVPAIVGLANATGDGMVSGPEGRTTHADPVAAAVVAASDAIELDQTLRIAWSTMAQFPNGVAELLRRARALAPQERRIVATCSCGVHLAGYEEWGPKDARGAPIRCDEIAEPDRAGLSLRCYHRRRRWQLAQRSALRVARNVAH